jgi:hypothetical protein
MNKQLLLCESIIAVVVLVLAGLSPVIGFNSVKSSFRDSPLFSIRKSRAINEDTMRITGEYINQDTPFYLPLPVRDTTQSKLHRIIGALKEMDEQEFNTLIGFLIRRVNPDVNADKVKTSLTLLRDNPEMLENYVLDEEQNDNSPSVDYWLPGCLIGMFLAILIICIGFTLAYISSSYPNLHFCQ